MPVRPPEFVLPLPNLWPRHVRCAIIHAISMAHAGLTLTRSSAANSWHERIRLKTENDRLRQEISLLQEEARIKDARMVQIPAHRRPHYLPMERMAILELRAARHWSIARVANRFMVTPATIAAWTARLDEEGPGALVQTSEPVNRFPDFVGYLVRRLKTVCPRMGTRRIANVLARAGLRLGGTTVRRMLREPRDKFPDPKPGASGKPAHIVTARRPNHVWHADLTVVPTAFGFWNPWFPLALPQRWPFCWWVAVAVDHFFRRVVGTAVFWPQPTSARFRLFLERSILAVGEGPRHLITDRGVQFIEAGFRRWCQRHGIWQRFGAAGKYGSIAVVERFIWTLKDEGTRQLILIPLRLGAFRHEIDLFREWYNSERPHETLAGRTPDEVFFGRRPASTAARLEPRARWPRSAQCAEPLTRVRGKPGAECELEIQFAQGRKHLPVISLRRAA